MIAKIDLLNKDKNVTFDSLQKYMHEYKNSMSQISVLQKIEQNEVIESTQPSGLGNEDYPTSSDTVDIFSKGWFTDRTSAIETMNADIVKNLNHINNLEKVRSLITKQNVVIPTAEEKNMYKMMQILKRPANISPEKFEREWCKVHAEMVPHTLPGALGYTQNLVTDRYISGEPVSYEELPIDGIVEFWFKDKESMNKAFSAPTAIEAINHARVFIDTISTFTIEYK